MNDRRKLAVCGYGRFGAALCDLALERGFEVTAFDPAASAPTAIRVGSLQELCVSANTLIVSVPLEHFEAALATTLPHLTTDHLVLDVGSVKLGPVDCMRKILGGRADWIGTHPLFGPTSLARGERPLRVVLSEGSENAKRHAQELWTALGCECLQQSAKEHDLVMARSHALAFFLAKGLLDVGAGEGAAFSPPSFAAIEKTISAVRSDAGHLFRSIQNRNPFACAERKRLIEALQRIHESLAQSDTRPPDEETPLPQFVIPEEGQATSDSTAALLAELEGELEKLLARRELLRARLHPRS